MARLPAYVLVHAPIPCPIALVPSPRRGPTSPLPLRGILAVAMPESLLWWAAVQLVGVAVTPIALALFRWLPDRGYVFGKSLGLLLVAYVLWVGGLTGVLPNERFSILGIVLALAVVSAGVTWRTRAELDAYPRRQWAYILFAEVLFAVTFATAAVLRSYAPDLASGEKPMNFAFLNALLRADSFPPQDPWLSGHTPR